MKKNFDTKKIKAARTKYGLTKADLVREIQKHIPTCSLQLISYWENNNVTPGFPYQKVLTQIFRDIDFYQKRPLRGLITR